MAKLLLYNSLGRVVSGCRCGDLLQPNSQKFVFIDFGNRLDFNFLTLLSAVLKPCWRSAVDHLPCLFHTPSFLRSESLT